jgi:hypothetical protein
VADRRVEALARALAEAGFGAADDEAASSILAALDASDPTAWPVVPDYEEMRRERGWPTPNHMRRAAEALDVLSIPAKYGDVLRWVADLCDSALAERRHP